MENNKIDFLTIDGEEIIMKENFNQEAELKKEQEAWLESCGSCIHFGHFMAEAGFCKIAECNCLCKNPKAMIDIWNDKCDKWIVNPNCL